MREHADRERTSQPTASTEPDTRRRWLLLLPAAAAVFPYLALFLPGLPGPETDPMLSRLDPKDPVIRSHGPGPDRLYSPLGTLASTVVATATPATGDPDLVPRLFDVVLHALAALAVGAFAFRLLRDRLWAALAASLWAVLPIHADAVAGTVGRGEILAALGCASAAAGVLAIAERGRRAGTQEPGSLILFATSAAFFLALLSRGSSLFLLLWLPIALAVLGLRLPRFLYASFLSSATALFLLASYAGVESSSVSFAANPLGNAAPAFAFLQKLRLPAVHLAGTILPFHLSSDHSYREMELFQVTDPVLWTQILVYWGGLACLVAWSLRKRPGLAVSLLFFALAILPRIGIPNLEPNLYRERQAMTAAMAFPLALAALATLQTGRRRRLALVAAAGLIVLYGARTALRSLEHRAPYIARISLEAPRSAPAHLETAKAYRALLLRGPGSPEHAELTRGFELHLSRALELLPNYPEAQVLRGEELFAQGRIEDASIAFDAAARSLDLGISAGARYRLHRLRGECRLSLHRPESAAEDLESAANLAEALALVPELELFKLQGIALGQSGRLDDAIQTFSTAIALRQDLPALWNNRAFARFQKGDLDGAKRDYEKGLAILSRTGPEYASEGDSVWSFLERIAEVQSAKVERERAAGRESEANAAEEDYRKIRRMAEALRARAAPR